MSGNLLRLIPGVITVVVGTLIAISQTGAAIQDDLVSRATAALAGPARQWAEVSVDGRALILDGIATDRDEVARAAAALAAVPGSSGVDNRVAIADPISPYPFVAVVSDGGVVLQGAFPSRALKAEWAALAPGARDETVLHSGAPAAFGDATRFALQTALLLDQGAVSLSDSLLTVTGRARDSQALETLTQLKTTQPPTLTLAGLDVTPPRASPYVLTASFDGKALTITGNTPDLRLVDRLRALVPSGIDAQIDLSPASGEPADFDARVSALVRALLTLERGELRLTDGAVALSGAPGSAAIAQAAQTTVAQLGGTATLDPPRIAAYGFGIAKASGKLVFSGFVPDEAMRTAFAGAANADVSGLKLGRGAPEGFAAASQLGLGVLARLSEGQFTLDGAKVSITGRTATLDDFRAATALVATPLPAGLSYAETAIHPPVASPFIWSASKAADGTISMKGFAPGDAEKAALWNRIPQRGADEVQPADGAPDGFMDAAEAGLDILGLYDTGRLSFDGTGWSLSGNVDTARKGTAINAAFTLNDLAAKGWTLEVKLPALPTISPYVLRAQKGPDGAIAATGYLPDDVSKEALAAAATTVKDATVLGAGAPADFADAFAAGLAALMQLQQGSLTLTGEKWTLAGDVADAQTRDAVQAALMARIAPANWQVAIQAQDAAPIVTPYLWSAVKGTDGTVVLAGYVPSEDARNAVTEAAGAVAGSTLSVASGEPAGFAADALAGLEALRHLTRGRAEFDGRSWTLSGGVESQAEGEAAVAALQKGSAGGKLWTTTLTGYVPQQFTTASSSQAPSVSEMASSSAPADLSSSASSAEPSASSAQSASSSSSSSSMEMAPAASSSSMEPSSSAASASDAPSSSAAEPSAPSSSSAMDSSSSALEAVTSSSAPSSAPDAPAEPDVAVETVTPLPETLLFAGTKRASGGIALSGATPGKDVATALNAIPGVRGGKLAVSDTLPADFVANATAGLTALAELEDGQVGYDGTGWWLHGRAASAAAADKAKAGIAALPQGGAWNTEIKVLNAFDICRIRADAVSERNAIAFMAGKRELSEDSLAVLDELAADLMGCPEAIIRVQAHTDGDGDARQNLVLSVARAESVVAELVKRGLAEDRLYAEGYGESDPVAENDTKANKARNRRVVIVVSRN